jgi:hypothetical protein
MTSDEYVVLSHAPMLFGRDENNHSDVPLVMYYQDQKLSGGARHIVYSVIWSNEDGGTNTLGLITTWGRTTDIEWIYDLTLTPTGDIEREVFQGPNHQVKTFAGRRIGKHPILRTATTNNNVVDSGSSPFLFGMYPSQSLPGGAAREVIMDSCPWTYRIAATELAREGKQRPALQKGASDLRVLSSPRLIADLRRYVYIDFTAKSFSGNIGFAVKRRNDPTWYGWYPHNGVSGINRSGTNRVAVEMPDGTTTADLEAIRVFTKPATNEPGYGVLLTDIEQVFMLDQDYKPQPSVAEWHGSQILNANNDNQIVVDIH